MLLRLRALCTCCNPITPSPELLPVLMTVRTGPTKLSRPSAAASIWNWQRMQSLTRKHTPPWAC